jgi:hypothetical protein
MQGIGGLLVLLGAGSFVLHFMNKEFALLGWVDNWGVGVGNGIRIAMIVVGVIIWFLGSRQASSQETPPQS